MNIRVYRRDRMLESRVAPTLAMLATNRPTTAKRASVAPSAARKRASPAPSAADLPEPAPEAAAGAPTRTPAELRAEVDRVLDKISAHGLGALTLDERRTLDEAKHLLNGR